jgi:hypothetical protein
MHFNDSLGEIHQPELVDAGCCLECRLDSAVLLQRCIGDLDNQERAVWMRSAVVCRRHDRDVWPRLRVLDRASGLWTRV